MNLKYITITSLKDDRLGSQMNNFAMLFLIAQKTGHTVGILNNHLSLGTGQKLITETFNAPVEIIEDSAVNNMSLLYWDTTSNINLPKQENIFELDSNSNYNVCAGLIHFNFLYFLNKQNLDYLKQNIFRFHQQIQEESQQYFNTIKVYNKKILSVHVRRTDHCTLSPEYQKQAIKLFDSEEYKVLMLSDDIEFCKNEFRECLAEYETVYSNNISAVDMHLMTLCDVNITADSTFSMWGALLNDADNEMVIPRSLLPTSMNIAEILMPVKKFRALNW